jgi:predicted PurR-regulated permease PerM
VVNLDDRTGNVLTTIAVFAAVALVAYTTRAILVVLVLALLFAYLLEPLVGRVEALIPSRSHKRAAAIALVYLIGALLLGIAGYALEPAFAVQMRWLRAAWPDLVARVGDRRVLAPYGALIASAVDRGARGVTTAAADAGWLLTVPIVAIFLLANRGALIEGTVDLLARRQERSSVRRTVERIDAMLAQYLRAQVTLAGLSAAFYGGSTALLGFPYPLALGVLGGALEFLPVIGWILAAAVILTAGWLTGAHWIWMVALLLIWRLVQNFVNSPRIMGNRLDMEPLTVLFVLMAGGQIGGLLGVVLSVPVAAVLHIIWLERASRQKAAVA